MHCAKKSEPGLITFKLIIDEDAQCTLCASSTMCFSSSSVVPAELRMNTHTRTPLYVPLSSSIYFFPQQQQQQQLIVDLSFPMRQG